MNFDIIKETTGKASEYAPYVIELYQKKNGKTEQVENALNRLEKDAAWLKENKFKDEIILCSETDPYPADCECYTITSKAIKILDENELKYVILTENAMRAIPDFEQLEHPENITLIIKILSIQQDTNNEKQIDEQFIDLTFIPLNDASKKGIKIWIELNSATDQALSLQLQLIYRLHPIVNKWNVGKDSFEPKTESKSTWEKFKENEKELFKTLKTLSPWTSGDIPIRKGNRNILVIAPHGHKADDENTGKIAWQIADILDCYAVINEFYRKPPNKKDKKGKVILNKKTGEPEREKADKNEGWVDLNNLGQIKGQLDEEFLRPIKKFKNEIVNRFETAQIFIIHGITNKNIKAESKTISAHSELAALIGIGRGNPNEDPPFEDRLSAHPDTAANLMRLLQSDKKRKIIAAEASQGHGHGGYAGWDIRNLNQLFTDENENDPNVQSVQIEIKMTGYRNDAHIPNTSGIFADAFKKMDNFKAIGILPAPDEDDIDLVDRAYAELSDIFYSNIGNAIFKAGEFIVSEFYNNEIELVKSKNPVKKQSLNKLIKKIQGDSHKQLSRSWIFNAVKLYVETKELETTVQTYGQLPISHKILLFPIHNSSTKLQLIHEAVENKCTVVELKNRITELMAVAKPEIEAPKSLLQVVKNPDLLFSDNYALDRGVKFLSKLKPAELEKIHKKAKANLLDIEHDVEEIELKLTTQREHVRNYKKLLKSVERAKEKGKGGKKLKS